MTVIFWALPMLHVRQTAKARRRAKGERNYAHKYDHWQMAQDRMAGMTWAEVEKKHGIGQQAGPGQQAWRLFSNSGVAKRLKPHEAAIVFRGNAWAS